MLYIFDIDGTLADISHRLHLIKQKPANWTAFFAACREDKPIPEVLNIANALASEGYRIVYVTGRSDEIREQTGQWLMCFGAPYGFLFMRKQGDHREDSIVKAELLVELEKKFPDEKIAGVFEDRQQVVDMYRAKGLRVFQVADGKF